MATSHTMIPCCNFPTTLLLIDDDMDFLEVMQLALKGQYESVCETDLKKARDIVVDNQGWVQSLWSDAVISRIYQDADPSLFSVSMDVSMLKNQIYNSHRFKHIAVMIIDYDMPEQNGLDFIRSLDDDQIKVIMLTGKAGQDTIIKAFNDKEIHRYVSKGDPNYIQTILQCVKELQNEFFVDASKFIIDALKISETKVFSNKTFQAMFNNIIKDNNIVEYYLSDELGSFFFQDADAKNQLCLVIKSDEELNYLFELSTNDKDCPIYVIKKLRDHELIPYFKTSTERHLQVKLWNLFDAQPLDDSKEYYYTLIKDSKDLGVNQSLIKSYSDFLRE